MSFKEGEIKVAQGGLMRCCTGTIKEKDDDGSLYKLEPGTGFKCYYCKSWIKLGTDGVVHWWSDHVDE